MSPASTAKALSTAPAFSSTRLVVRSDSFEQNKKLNIKYEERGGRVHDKYVKKRWKWRRKESLKVSLEEEFVRKFFNEVSWVSTDYTHTHTHTHTLTHTHTHTHALTHTHKPSIICLSLGCLWRNSRNNSDIGIASRTSTLRCATISPTHSEFRTMWWMFAIRKMHV